MRDRGWVEFTVYPLFSPQSLIAEGTANYGIEVAFPPAERLGVRARRAVPAGRARPDAGRRSTTTVLALVDRLSYAGNEAARRYLNGEIDRAGRRRRGSSGTRCTRGRAPSSACEFIDQYRSYVINYNLGKDLVRRLHRRRPARPRSADMRWREFAALLSSPRLPSGLKIERGAEVHARHRDRHSSVRPRSSRLVERPDPVAAAGRGADRGGGRRRQPARRACSGSASIRRRRAPPTFRGSKSPARSSAVGPGVAAVARRRRGVRAGRRRRLRRARRRAARAVPARAAWPAR